MQVMRDHPNPRRRPHLGIWCRSIRHRRAISAHQRPPPCARRRSPRRAADPGRHRWAGWRDRARSGEARSRAAASSRARTWPYLWRRPF